MIQKGVLSISITPSYKGIMGAKVLCIQNSSSNFGGDSSLLTNCMSLMGVPTRVLHIRTSENGSKMGR